MLSPHAYSFRQKSRLAISLSWVGGYTNVVSVLAFATVLSHQTGNTTMFGKAVGEWDAQFLRFGYLLITFFLGAVCSAVMTESTDRRGISSRYILPMATEAMLLSAYALLIAIYRPRLALGEVGPFWVTGIAAFAMGLQNATITKISGAVVRTTHVTGVVTDLGLEGVQLFIWLRDKFQSRRPERLGRVVRVTRRHPSAQRVALLGSIYGSFLFGILAGTLIYQRWPSLAMLAPVLFLLWIIFVDYRKPIAAVTELDLLGDSELKLYGIVKSLLPAELGIYRLSHHRKDSMHHAPNFQVWVNRLPARWRVIILAVSALTRFDAESVADLRTAAERLQSTGRELILSGVNPVQFKLMDTKGLTDVIATENFCADLEFAIARGIDLSGSSVLGPDVMPSASPIPT